MMPWLSSPFPTAYCSCLRGSTTNPNNDFERLGRERRGHDELDARLVRNDFQRRVQLFGERAHHAGAQALSLAKLEAFRKSVAFVANGDKKAVDAGGGDVNPHIARALALIGVLRGVRHQLVDDQRR